MFKNLDMFKLNNQEYRINTEADELIKADLVYGLDVEPDSLMFERCPPAINCSGYGSVTLMRLHLDYYSLLQTRLDAFLGAVKDGSSEDTYGFLPGAEGRWRAVVVRDKTWVWVFIIDGTVSYSNFSFLLSETPYSLDQYVPEEEMNSLDLKIHTEDFVFCGGDENSDNNYSSWLMSEEPEMYNILEARGWITPQSE